MSNFNNKVRASLTNILEHSLSGSFPVHISNVRDEHSLTGNGISVFLGSNPSSGVAPKTRNIVSISPQAVILLKKKAFSSLKSANDLQWMDKTEKMLLRATKALFAYKVSQLRAYESLTKFENFFSEHQQISFSILNDLVQNAKYLSVGSTEVDTLWQQITSSLGRTLQDLAYDAYKEDILGILKRNAFSTPSQLTTWIVDPYNLDNYQTGPGTGVIELCNFTNFRTSTRLSADPSRASFQVEDPYRILNIIEEDIEYAIEEALKGTYSLFSDLARGSTDIPPLDAVSTAAAIFELAGLGNLDSTINTDYIRERLRVFYLGKTIINAADTAHFYIRGNRFTTRYGTSSFDQSDKEIDLKELEVDDIILEAERNLYTNKYIDIETYKKMRSLSDNSFGMTHVYAGIVMNTSESFSGGRWSLSVECSDNMEWLKWSRYMAKPAAQNFVGPLEDPLTPYEIKRDDTGAIIQSGGVELINENKYLLQTGLLSYDTGLFNGINADEANLLQGQYNEPGSLYGKKILQHPNGFVYRWKSGIGTATANLSSSPRADNVLSMRAYNYTYAFNIYQDILANLDIANILSTLIVGQPYNAQTFFEKALQAGSVKSANILSTDDPLSSVLDVVRKQNEFYGNFKPYRMITMSSSSTQLMSNDFGLRSSVNDRIRKLQESKLIIKQQLSALQQRPELSRGLLVNSLQMKLSDVQRQIRDELDLFNRSTSDNSAYTLNFNFGLSGDTSTVGVYGQHEVDHDLTRAMMLIGAQRRIEDVRLNRDSNLFVVSDQYDQSMQITPYLLSSRAIGLSLFSTSSNNYVTIHEKCMRAAQIANMEFFTNSQGHIEFRPPQWNKIPLTVLRAMYSYQKQTGKKVLPDFLFEMFETRIGALQIEIHKLNIRIVILALLLGKFPDRTLIPGINSGGIDSLKFFGIQTGENDLYYNTKGITTTAFGDMREAESGVAKNSLTLNISLSESGDILDGDTRTILGTFDPIFQESSTSNIYDSIIDGTLTAVGGAGGSDILTYATIENVNSLRTTFLRQYGIDVVSDFNLKTEGFTTDNFAIDVSSDESDVSSLSKVDKAKNILSTLEKTISRRDSLVSVLNANLQKKAELNALEQLLTQGTQSEIFEEVSGPLESAIDIGSKLLNAINTTEDIISGTTDEGTLFDHLIEDDTRNMLGPGSSKRFIITDDTMLTCSFTERPPDFTRIDVFGDAPLGIGDSLRNTFDNHYFWSGASDFDLWRQYGYKYSSVSVPFFSDAETQSKPYAFLLLQLQRAKINSANISVVGNEYYQPGDCVYLPDKGLIYYVTSVNHTYSVGSQFTTELVLENGHPPGIYLPSPMDVIGEQYMKDPLGEGALVYKNEVGDDRYRTLKPDSCIVFPPNVNISQDNVQVLLNYRDNQIRLTNMMIDLSALLIGKRKILIRGFVKNSADTSDISDIRTRMEIVKYLLQNPLQISQYDSKTLGDDLLDTDIGGSTDVIANIASTFGIGSGNTKSTSPMILPNGLEIVRINSEQIIEQITYMDKTSGATPYGIITCLNGELLGEHKTPQKNLDADIASKIFPAGGPKQSSWLDIRDDLTKVANIIEIGILDISDDL